MHSRVTVVKVSLGSVRQGFLPAAKKHDLSVVSGGGREKRFRRRTFLIRWGFSYMLAAKGGCVRLEEGRCDICVVSALSLFGNR